MKDSAKVLPTVSKGMEESLAGFEIREYRIPVAAVDLLEEGETLLLDRVPAGASILWGPRLTENGDAVSMAVSVPTGGSLIPIKSHGRFP